MKKYIIAVIFQLIFVSVYSQNYQSRAESCYEKGDYECARENYRLYLFESPNDKKVEELREKAGECATYKLAADIAFKEKRIQEACDNYNEILKINPKDPSANNWKDLCSIIMRMSERKHSFKSSGDSVDFYVIPTKMDLSYDISELPTWCSVKRNVNYLKIIANPNPDFIIRSDSFLVNIEGYEFFVNISQLGKEKLFKVLKSEIFFQKGGGSKKIPISINMPFYDIADVPSWCSVEKEKDYFVINCDTNFNDNDNERNHELIVKAGGIESKVKITQSGVKAFLSVSEQNLSLSSRGGFVKVIVDTNEPSYEVKMLQSVSWCSVIKHEGYFVVSCFRNDLSSDRDSRIEVKTEDQVQYINIRQKKPIVNRDFNEPKTSSFWGISAGYVNKMLVSPFEDNGNYYEKNDGFQIGIRYLPLFKYGFGVNTGLFFEFNMFEFKDENKDKNFKEHNFVVPLNIEYRLNFHERFNIFFYGGIGIEAHLTHTKDKTEPRKNVYSHSEYIQTTWEYGTGVRIYNVQINLEQSFRINKGYSFDFQNGKYKFLGISMTYMFPNDDW